MKNAVEVCIYLNGKAYPVQAEMGEVALVAQGPQALLSGVLHQLAPLALAACRQAWEREGGFERPISEHIRGLGD